MKELAWGWERIACVLVYKLAPDGLVITRKDLASLPEDRVLIEERTPEHIYLWFATLAQARKLADPVIIAEKVRVSELQGRWQKTAAVLLWKLAKDGVVLTPQDRDAVPADKTLLMHGHAQDLELRFVPVKEAERIYKHERDNEGRIVLEAVK